VVILDDYENLLVSSAHLGALSDEVDLVSLGQPVEPTALTAALAGAPMVIAIRERTRFTDEVLSSMADVELLLQTGGHAYHVDVEAATRRGILVALGRGSNDPAPVVAELVIGFMISWYRSLFTVTAGIRVGEWPAVSGRLLSGRTLGILGLGRHGTTVARLARAFGMKVVAWGPTLTPERAAAEGALSLPLDDVLRQADVISVHLRLAPSTTHLIGERELRLMGPNTLLINTARGSIVDEAALITALREGLIEGAALDVFEQEPLPENHPLRTLDNAMCTSHIGYTVDAAFNDFAETSAKQLRAYLRGELDPALVLNPEAVRERVGVWGGLAPSADE